MECFRKKLESHPQVLVLAPTCNHMRTRDGINRGAQRILDQVESLISGSDQLTKVSYICHSLGGLYARQVIYLAHTITDPKSKLSTLTPINFITLSTPHVGSRHFSRVFHDVIVNTLVPIMFGKTGRQVLLLDVKSKNGDPPMLVHMVSDLHIELLSRFSYLATYANIANDLAVPYCTSAIRLKSIFKRKRVCQKSVGIAEEKIPPPLPPLLSGSIHPDNIAHDLPQRKPLENYMLHVNDIHDKLDKLPWHRFGCYFARPFVAHINIINKTLLPFRFSKASHPVVDHVLAGLELN